MRQWLRLRLSGMAIVAIMAIVACATSQPAPKPTVQLKQVTLDTSKIVVGQTVYVPIYSHIYTVSQSRSIDLTATLSIRNTDLSHSIVIASVRYYDTAGNLVRTDLENPVELPALASTDFVVDQADTEGGVGANFIVEWAAETAVSDPVIEAVMIDTLSNQGISFISPGRVIQRRSSAGS